MATLTVFPNTNDGSAHNDTATNWATNHDDVSSTNFFTGATSGYIESSATGANATKIGRLFENFDTSALGADATVSAVTSYVYGDLKEVGNGQTHNLNVYGSTSTDPPGTADYDQGGTTAYADTPIERANWSTTGYNSWVWNATGTGAILVTGTTKICYRDASFDVPNTAPTIDANNRSYVTGLNSSQTGTDKDPYLSITYTVTPTAAKVRRNPSGNVAVGGALNF